MTDALTILTTTGARCLATKEWRRTPDGWLKTDYKAGAWFSHQGVPVDGVQDIATAQFVYQAALEHGVGTAFEF